MTEESTQKLSLASLLALVIGSMVGAGIFSLPSTFGRATGPFGALIAWTIAGFGMLMLAFVFQSLANRKPDLDAGVFAYARAGFGGYMGFLSALGYWSGTCIGNVSYFLLIMSTLGLFFQVFGQGNTLLAVIISSVILWSVHFMILRGVKQAAALNTIATIAKIVPISVFILVALFTFRGHLFAANFWGGGSYSLSDVFGQVRSTMLVTVFVFLGVEGASVYSRYARNRADVGTATLLGFVAVLCLLVLVTLLPYGHLARPELGALQNPSMAGVLEAIVGRWGTVFIAIGLIISVLGAYLSWSLLAAEVLWSAAKSNTMPVRFARENANAVPAAALWLTNIVVQVFLVLTLFAQQAFILAVELTSSMNLIPYLLVAAYAVLIAWRRETYDLRSAERRGDLIRAAIATIYTAFLIYAGGLKFLLLSTIIYAPGTILYYFSRREQNLPTFSAGEWGVFAVASVGAIYAIYGLFSGAIPL